MPIEPSLGEDLVAARQRLADRRADASSALEAALDAARSEACRHAFLELFEVTARAEAAAVDARFRAGAPLPALGGLAVSIKALFDVQGHRTTAGSRLLADAPPAARDSTAVQRPRYAGQSGAHRG